VSDNILLKPGRLSASEYSAMQRHTQIGYRLLAGSDSPLMSVAANVALCHHEWWDGGGYPRGLQGEEIPRLARIATVTDVFDALTSDRVYRPAIAVEETLEMMAELRGRQFEPSILDAFVDRLDDVLAVRAQYPEADEERRIRVLLVDDHEIFAESISRVLASTSGMRVVGWASTVAESTKLARAYDPDVVLMDFELPDGSGIEATEQIKLLRPLAKVVMLTGRTDQHSLARAIAAGCAGFVTKIESTDILIETIRAAYAGDETTGVIDLRPALGQLRPTSRGLGATLAPRETEVLALMADGLVNKEIAQRLNLSLNTVRNHVQSVLTKLNVHSKLEAVATGVREGIVAIPRQASGL